MMKKYGTFLLVIVIMILVFSFASMLEYRHSIEQEQNSLREDILLVQTNIENMISSRIINANVFAGLIELDREIDKELFDIFANKIYDSESHVVKDIVFITDTTITHVYPTYLGEGAIGIDLATIPEQRELLLYSKNKRETVFFGPVDLVEGGKGIIVRVPVVVEDIYYGIVAIVFDYSNFIEESGLKNLALINNVILEGRDPLSEYSTIIWSNVSGEVDNYITEKIYLHEVEWYIKAIPINGWNGFSPLLFLIIAVGLFVCIGSTTAYIKELRLKNELEKVNMGLQDTVKELAESKIELVDKYNEIFEKESFIQHQADHDELTGLYNRRLFRENLSEAISEGKSGLVVLLDIDDFKNINDIHGHLYGDELLKTFANTMKAVLKDSCRIYRFGGDEFLILFEQNYDDSKIKSSSEEIKDKLKARITKKIGSPMTLSTGVVRYPSQGKDVESLLIRADVAMYKSKNSGKNQLTIFEESLLVDLDRRIGIENHIRRALSNYEFEMNYQPIINTITGEIVSFEALIRLKNRVYSPIEFIDVAETSGFIVPLGEWILEEVFAKIASWIEDGLSPKPVAINLSPRQLIEPTFRNTFFKLIKQYNISMDLIEVEITENVFLENEEENIAVLRELRDNGIKVSMDDFGTGYSSLKYLTYLPIDKVKIDKSLKDQLIALDNSKVLSGIITMVHGLGMKVVAEGIEEADEWQYLADIGCDYLQGYLFSRPVADEFIPELLNSKPYVNK